MYLYREDPVGSTSHELFIIAGNLGEKGQGGEHVMDRGSFCMVFGGRTGPRGAFGELGNEKCELFLSL